METTLHGRISGYTWAKIARSVRTLILPYFTKLLNCPRSARPTRTCPLTGLTAQYLDPRTNVPFASVAGFQTLTKILAHEYVWCQSRGCYITPGNASGARLADTEHEEEDDAGRAAKKQKTGAEGE